MTESGYGVQIVTVADDHSYHLNEKDLGTILMNKDIKDLPVVVVSVAGAYRSGKSFLLNFFLRYLTSPTAARQDGTWIGEDNELLTGFSWRGGSMRNTTGILMWSEPFVITIPTGEKVAVLLIDTEGLFNSTSTIRDSSTIFAISTLVSSIQVYNLRDTIKEHDLQYLQFLTDFGTLMKNQTGKAFQVLEFLVRDWMYPWEYSYGQVDGQKYLDQRLKVTNSQPKELQKIRADIPASFDKVTCFLMPHPGLNVLKPRFQGKISEIGQEFRNSLKELASSIFSRETLCKKLVGGQLIKSRDLFDYFKSYITIFNGKEIPSPTTIFQATSEAVLQVAYNDAREQFEKNMGLACGPEAPGMPIEVVRELQRRELDAARATFSAKKLLGESRIIENKLGELTHALDNRYYYYMEINILKTQRFIIQGLIAYDKALATVTQGRQLCVHPADLRQVHNEAVEKALHAFRENRKIINGKVDTDEKKLNEELELKYQVLRQTNNQNNNSIVVKIEQEYAQYMIIQCNQKPKLSDNAFKAAHEKARERALDDFNSKRNRPNSYTEDLFKHELLQAISIVFSRLKPINACTGPSASASQTCHE